MPAIPAPLPDPTGATRFAEVTRRLNHLGYDTDDVEHLEPNEVAVPLTLLGGLVDRLGATLDPRLPDGRASS